MFLASSSINVVVVVLVFGPFQQFDITSLTRSVGLDAMVTNRVCAWVTLLTGLAAVAGADNYTNPVATYRSVI